MIDEWIANYTEGGGEVTLSLVGTTEELLERKSSGSGLETRDHGRRDPSRWPRGTLYPQTLALTSLTSGGRSVGSSLADSGHGVIYDTEGRSRGLIEVQNFPGGTLSIVLSFP
jgi:hypothetical protein